MTHGTQEGLKNSCVFRDGYCGEIKGQLSIEGQVEILRGENNSMWWTERIWTFLYFL